MFLARVFLACGLVAVAMSNDNVASLSTTTLTETIPLVAKAIAPAAKGAAAPSVVTIFSSLAGTSIPVSTVTQEPEVVTIYTSVGGTSLAVSTYTKAMDSSTSSFSMVPGTTQQFSSTIPSPMSTSTSTEVSFTGTVASLTILTSGASNSISTHPAPSISSTNNITLPESTVSATTSVSSTTSSSATAPSLVTSTSLTTVDIPPTSTGPSNPVNGGATQTSGSVKVKSGKMALGLGLLTTAYFVLYTLSV